jgi:dTDP-4-dehydrorhamnose reductase
MRILVTGSEGQVARSLREAAASRPHLTLEFAARPGIDLLRPETIAPALESFRPDLVINPAAYTAVDRAESEPDLVFAINRDGAGAVAAAAARVGAPIVHLSTDYVFDGAKPEPYDESDPTSPRGVYGRSKRDGEQAVAAANPRHVILRTSWVYAPFGGNFPRTVLRLSGERDRLRVVDDQLGCPTYAPDIAEAILTIAPRLTASAWRPSRGGATNLAGPDAVSWCGFARLIIAAAARFGGRDIPVDPIATADFPTPAERPANSRLATGRLAAEFGVRLPPLRQSIDRCVARLLAPEAAMSGSRA